MTYINVTAVFLIAVLTPVCIVCIIFAFMIYSCIRDNLVFFTYVANHFGFGRKTFHVSKMLATQIFNFYWNGGPTYVYRDFY